MARDVTDETPIGSRDELVAWIEAGIKEPTDFRIGTEHEKVPFYLAGATPVPFADTGGRGGIEALLKGLQARTGWEPIEDRGHLIGLFDEAGGGAISLEPGGQFELSGAPLATIHETRDEFARHMEDATAVAQDLGIGFLDLGMSPKWTRAQTPVMPKQRYAIMANYMPRVGTMGLDMMFRTATVQANLDFASEADMVAKLRVSLALQPVITALFANSPFTDGKPNGFRSMRSNIWLNTDADRTGMLPFAFEDGMGFERYVDYALDVPMYFVKRGDTYHDVAGEDFKALLKGELPRMPSERATLSDWANHLSTIFPEVRLKRFLEMRGADMGPGSHVAALPALCAGLFYDPQSLDHALQLVRGWSAGERQQLRRDVPAQALDARIGGRPVRDVARDVLAIARQGLRNRARRNEHGEDETIYLAPLDEIVERGLTLAQQRLALFEGAWDRNVGRAFADCRLDRPAVAAAAG